LEEVLACRCLFNNLYFGRIELYVGLLLRWLRLWQSTSDSSKIHVYIILLVCESLLSALI
jgi:hypothetical protein